MIIYTTKNGDVLDWIVWKHYGTLSVIEEVLKANPAVTDEVLKAGIKIKLPYVDTALKSDKEIRLWS